MDSANSGSMQSSSTAGDEEYDSRADPSSISAFFNTNPPPNFSTQFEPLSNYLDPTQRSQPNQILNLDMVWSKVAGARSEPDLSAFLPSSSSPHNNNNNQAFLLTQLGAGQSQPPTNLPLPPEGGGLVVNEPVNSNSNGVRNPKKRSRASRRAPTTVLTTDTTNFRAMVQEFTGIPAPPFTSSSFPRTRLDLFASSSSSSTIREQPSYLLRPFAQKLQAQPSSSIPPPMLNNHNNYQHQSQSLNMHHPIFSFQSILQPHPLGNNDSSVLVGVASKTQQPSLEIPPSAVDSSHSHLKMGGLITHAHVHQNINMVSSTSSDGALSMRGPSPADWAQAQAQRIGHNDGGGGVLGSLSGATLNYRTNVSDQRVKVNFSATPSSDFHGDKGPECAVAAARSEGMVESWINCSSD